MKRILDAIIMVLAVIAAYVFYQETPFGALSQFLCVLFLGIAVIAMLDLSIFISRREKARQQPVEQPDEEYEISELLLLDETDRPIKSWDLTGKISLLIGKRNKSEPVDIDLEECEYSSLIDPQHAVLNFCDNGWYIEDLYSKNGIRIKMVKDGIDYKLAKNKPCRLNAGDVIYIANTKLLIT